MIFCKNCKYYNGYDCIHKDNRLKVITFEMEYWTYRKEASAINKDNNCSKFKPTLIYTLKRFFLKNSKDI